MKIRGWFVALATALVMPTLACSTAEDPGDSIAETGTLSMELVGTAPSGNAYRLSGALFTVSDGGGPVTTLDSDVDPAASVLSADLPIGNYSISLGSGWSMTDATTGDPVEATLLSAVNQSFAINGGQTTTVAYQFRIAGEIIIIGGRLHVVLDISETTQPSAAAYIRGSSLPWGSTSNEEAMDLVFGAGGWSDLTFATVAADIVFSPAYDFVYIDGSDGSALELANFLMAERPRIESWVAAGGGLFLNAAPNVGGDIPLGFAGVTLVFPDFAENPGGPVDPGHPIWNGPFPTTTSFDALYLAHATVSGPGLIGLMIDADGGNPALAELPWGNGTAMFGGLTTSNFWNPAPEALHFRANIIAYTAGL
jgi:hypothetical protein